MQIKIQSYHFNNTVDVTFSIYWDVVLIPEWEVYKCNGKMKARHKRKKLDVVHSLDLICENDSIQDKL